LNTTSDEADVTLLGRHYECVALCKPNSLEEDQFWTDLLPPAASCQRRTGRWWWWCSWARCSMLALRQGSSPELRVLLD